MARELTQRQHEAVAAGRKAMAETIAAAYPLEFGPLLAVAITGAFADLCVTSSTAGTRALVEVINAQLREAGLALTPIRRN